MDITPTEKDLARFWSKVDRRGSDDCWNWMRSNVGGYGQIRIQRVDFLAHRFVWEMEHGPIPIGMVIAHRCDNPPCVNLAHLFLCTKTENFADRDAKGRTAKGERSGSYKRHRGLPYNPKPQPRQPARPVDAPLSWGDTLRFWEKVDVLGPDDCWLWNRPLDKSGAGVFGRPTRTDKAYRVSWELEYGPVPNGLCVLHRCDVRACVNPIHLFLGTQADNMADRDAKGRNARGEALSLAIKKTALRGDEHPRRRYPERWANASQNQRLLSPGCKAGERNGRARLTWEKVREIRRRAPNESRGDLAQEFGVTRAQINVIVSNKQWKEH